MFTDPTMMGHEKHLYSLIRAFAGNTSHFKIILILRTQLVVCMDCQFMK